MRARRLTRSAVIAAVYVILTFALSAISFGPVQFRLSEALCVLPVLCPEAVPGLFVGCLLANLVGGAVWFDTVFGSLTTLLAAFVTRRLRRNVWAAMASPVVLNALIVGCVVYAGYVRAPGEAFDIVTALTTMGSVGLGEAVSVYAAGGLLLYILKRTNDKTEGRLFGKDL